jgi:hypothetical protein
MKLSLILAALALPLAQSAHADILILRDGKVFVGSIKSHGADGYKFERGATTVTYPNSVIVQSFQSRPKAEGAAEVVLPSWGTALEQLSAKAWASNLKQIPSTVVDKGILRNVPYQSYRCGIDYEINIYGDPEHPSAIEIGIYRSLLNQPAAKENCIQYVAELVGNQVVRDAVLKAKRTKDLMQLKEWTAEITPPEADDSYGGWWISIYSETMLNGQRASPEEMQRLTVPNAQIAKGQDAASGWTQGDLKFARPLAAVPTPASEKPVTPSVGGSTGGVYVRGYTRKDGTYVSGYTRRR